MFELPDLPYDYEALSPVMSPETLHFHHDKHHRAYVEKTNELAKKAGLVGRTLEDVVREAHAKADKTLFNNSAQAWNHAFFWRCMTPERADPSGVLKEAIDQAFGDLDGLKEAFVEEGKGHFGSGWVWIVTAADGLKVISTHDADDTLIKDGLFPLLVCDLWEHAYYLDHQNDRPGFLTQWFDELANWSFAERQLQASQGKGEGFRYLPPGASSGGPGRNEREERPGSQA
jgi:Fe-Mn family superoxide dismutase